MPRSTTLRIHARRFVVFTIVIRLRAPSPLPRSEINTTSHVMTTPRPRTPKNTTTINQRRRNLRNTLVTTRNTLKKVTSQQQRHRFGLVRRTCQRKKGEIPATSKKKHGFVSVLFVNGHGPPSLRSSALFVRAIVADEGGGGGGYRRVLSVSAMTDVYARRRGGGRS